MKKQHFITIFALVVAIAGYLYHRSSQQSEEIETLKVVAILPLSGPTAFMGEYCRNGIDLASDGARAQGKSIQITYHDSKNDPKEGLAAFSKSRVDSPSAVIAAMSSVAMGLAPVCEEANIPLVATTVSAGGVTNGKEWMFRLFINADIDAKLMAEFATKTKGYKHVGITRVNDEMGTSFAKVFSETLTANGATVAFEETFEKTQTDFKSLSAKLATKQADAIYLLGYDQNLGLLARELRAAGIESQFLATATISQKPVVDAAVSAVEGAYFTSVLFDGANPHSEQSGRFVENYQKKFNAIPTYFSAFAFDAFALIAEASSMDGSSPNAVRDGIRKITNYEGATGTITIQPNGDALFPMIVKQLKSGVGVPVSRN